MSDWAGLAWLFVLLASSFVVFVIWLAASKYGRIPLGRDGEEPEFRTLSWIAMMFSAGMGIGLMFFAVAEPISHLTAPPAGTAPKGNPIAVPREDVVAVERTRPRAGEVAAQSLLQEREPVPLALRIRRHLGVDEIDHVNIGQCHGQPPYPRTTPLRGGFAS